ncbi:MAG TPA: LuxR C-terminal-related transcriptional regulator [Bacillota bacterium]|nr:LuxR C-terminal-related transcriptional regulator [Bacillota bacterium]
MAEGGRGGALHACLDELQLSVIVHSLFSSWMLAFLFEGQILYALSDAFGLRPGRMVFGGIAALFAGLLLCGFLIKTKKAARRLFLCSYPFFIAASAVFFLPPSVFWDLGVITSSFLAGCCVAAWGFYFRSATPKNDRMGTAADVLIWSNVLMIPLNVAAIHLSPRIGLALSMLMLLGAFLSALRLPPDDDADSGAAPTAGGEPASLAGSLALLCLFILAITVNSGLMYQVINPAFAHHASLTSWYWAIPYIVAVYLMKNPAFKMNRNYMLYVALAMIGFSFIAFVFLDRSATSYLVVNTLMLGACGIYDLFWWSVLGEMLDYCENPASVFGIGLSANVLGVLLGGLIGKAVSSAQTQALNPTLLALAVVCVTLALLPPLHRRLCSLLKDHAYLAMFSEISPWEQSRLVRELAAYEGLSERERQVASLLLQRKTYKMIGEELFISENTVKYYVKNIYSKLGIRSREELIDMVSATAGVASQGR